MPAKWFIPIPEITPENAVFAHIHAAFNNWFDSIVCDHHAPTKPYSVSALTQRGQHYGLEVGTLTPETDLTLKLQAQSAAGIRLGQKTFYPNSPWVTQKHSWAELATPTTATAWRLDFHSPITFRKQKTSSPLPRLDTILKALDRAWHNWSTTPKPGFADETLKHLHVTDVELTTHQIPTIIGNRKNPKATPTLNCATGHLVIEADNKKTAAKISHLLQLAEYTGTGSMPTWGLGATTVVAKNISR